MRSRGMAVVAVVLLVATSGCIGGLLGGGGSDGGDGGDGQGSIAIETEPASDLNESWRYVYVEPRGDETLPAGTTVNATLRFEIQNQTQEESLVATLNESVSAGTKVYLGAGTGSDFGLSVGETPGESGAIKPNELPTEIVLVVTVDAGGTTETRTITFSPEDG